MAAPSSWRGYKCDLFFCIDSRTCGSGWVFGLESRYMHLHVSRIQSYHSATAIAAWMTYYVFGHVLFLACTGMCRIWLYVMCCVFPFSLHVLSVSLCRLSVLNLWAKRGHGLILVTATAFPCSQTNILFHHSLTAWLKKKQFHSRWAKHSLWERSFGRCHFMVGTPELEESYADEFNVMKVMKFFEFKMMSILLVFRVAEFPLWRCVTSSSHWMTLGLY